MTKATARVRIKLALTKRTVPDLVSTLRSVANAITGNPNLTAADVAKLPVATTDMLVAATGLETTHNARPTAPTKANTALEKSQRDAVSAHLTDTAAFLEGLANAKAAGDRTKAQAIIASFGFQTRAAAATHPRTFECLKSPKGTLHVRMVSPTGRGAHAHLVKYSADGEKTWSFPVVVLGVELIVTGLKSATTMSVRHATVTAPPRATKATVAAGAEEPSWSDAITYVVA